MQDCRFSYHTIGEYFVRPDIRYAIVITCCRLIIIFVLYFFRHFDASDKSDKEAAKLFSVPDFVGDSCKAIASRIRGAVAGVQFDDFHKVCF